MQKNINISDRVAYQVPDFIREEDQQFVNFLFEFYKSQEKTGKPYDILNNLTHYLDVDTYDAKTLSAETTLLKNIEYVEDLIEVESIDGFIEKDGSVIIDSEVIYYESLTRGPDAILTPGISLNEFRKKEQFLESPYSLFDGTQNTFALKFLGEPVAPISSYHLIVKVYDQVLVPETDYYVEGNNIRFATAPRAVLGTDNPSSTSIIYMVGFAGTPIVTMDALAPETGSKVYKLRYQTGQYTPVSAVGLIVNRNNILQRPYEDYVLYQSTDDGSYVEFRTTELSESEFLDIRSVEYNSPSIGTGATAVSSVDDDGNLINLIVRNGGNGYRLDFAPKVTITPSDLGGIGATARTLVAGVKNIQLINGGQGYTSYNPPLIEIAAPTNSNGTQATADLTVDDTTGEVNAVTITNSGSGYDFIPAVTFKNPGGAEITDPTIDSEGRLTTDSITVVPARNGFGYKNPPSVYIDPAPEGGINAAALAILTPEGQVSGVSITNRGRGYTSAPRARIIQPIGAQVLGVTVASGSVTDIDLLTGGRGYTDAPSVYIVDDRKDAAGVPIGGTGATAVATIFNGSITDISITNFGSGYDVNNPPKIFIAEPSAARSSVDVGFDEVTGFDITTPGRDYKPSALVGCVRGVSGTVDYDNYGNQIFATEDQLSLSNHVAGTKIVSLDTLFLRQLFEKLRRQYLPTITVDYTKVNPIQVIKKIRDFYLSKGTKTATQFLFKILFGEEVDVYYPKDEVISPSAATWVVDTILRATLIEGDPRNLIDGQLQQYNDEVDNNVSAASALIENVISIIEGTDTIYELSISEETLQGNFIIPYKTKLVEFLSETDQIITVDSTIGWPERNGTIRINDEEVVQYKERSLNQFIECTRSKNGIVEDWDPGTLVYSDIYIYVDRGLATECKLRVLGIAEAGSTILDDTGSYYLEGDKLTVAALGSTDQDEKLSSWLYNVKKLIQVTSANPGGQNNQTATIVTQNPHGLLVEDLVTVYGANPTVYNGTFEVTARLDEFTFSYQMLAPTDIVPQGNILLSVDLNRGKSEIDSINTAIQPYTSNIQNSFFNSDYIYVAATGLPNYKVGPFTGTALIPGNQRKLLRFPREVTTVSKRETIAPNSSIGAWVNGVSIWSYKSNDFVRFGPITTIDINNGGQGYDAGNKPNLIISGGGGTGASADVTVNGSLFSIEVTAGGSGYLTQPLVSVVGGSGIGATAQAVITGGVVSRVLVEQPGTGYTSQPTISITGGGGTGALATASVRGPIQAATLTSGGVGYTSLPSVIINSGTGALAQPIVINGRIVSIAIINSGEGYTTAPNVVINGDGFGAVAKAVIGTIGEDKGRVISIQLQNKGINYTQGLTTIRLESVGEFAEFTPNVFQWTKNLQFELETNYDFARGYVFTGYNNQFGGEYAHLVDPKELRYVVGDNVFLDPQTTTFQELASNNEHSPIIGWAYDGNPIYGPYGYIDPTDQNSGLRRLRTSYRLKSALVYEVDSNPTPSRGDGPPLATYAAGSFTDDYEYAFQLGDLDPYNGRFCKTPQFPEGTYAYFITIDESDAGQALFPYIIGPQFYSQPDAWNMNQDATQDNIPTDVVRYRDPFSDVDIDVDRQPNKEPDTLTTELEGYPLILEIQDTNNDGLIDSNEQLASIPLSEENTLQIYDYFPTVSAESRVDIEVETTTKFESAQIDGFVVENPGVSYQVEDVIFFNNEGTGGFGASAEVAAVEGKSISAYSKVIEEDIVYGKITTTENHDLRVGDQVIVESSVISDNTNKTYYTNVVSGIEDIVISQQGVGYNELIPPTYELITDSGQDAEININVIQTGQVETIDIINSGNSYDPENPPQIRVSHPQIFKKTRYFFDEYGETTTDANGTVIVNHTLQSDDRYTYACGQVTKPDGNSAAWIGKFDDLGALIWDRTLETISGNTKTARFNQMYLDERAENDIIYVVGETEYDNVSANYAPDILYVKYESGFDNANNAEGQVRYQKEIAGVSGTTRRDYAMGVTLGEEERVYICGYTDTNSPDPDDMWVIQFNEDGEMREKRKFSSETDDERMHQIRYLGNNSYQFVGLNMTDYYMIVGEFYFDGNNLELRYVKNVNPAGGRPQRPRFVIDEYDAFYCVFDLYNNSIQKNSAIGLFKLPRTQINENEPTFEFYKVLAPSEDFVSINHSDITIDVFGNLTLVSDVKYTENSRKIAIHYIKFDGTVLKQSTVESVDTVGLSAQTHIVDNSGDVVTFSNKQISDQVSSYRYNGSDGAGGFIASINNITGITATRGAGVQAVGTISGAVQARATNIGNITVSTGAALARGGLIATLGSQSGSDTQRAGTVATVSNFSAAEALRGGAVNDVTNISTADPKRGGVIATVDTINAADSRRGGRVTLVANPSAANALRGGKILGTQNVGAGNPSRTAGTYLNVTNSSSANGTGATFSVTVNNSGAASVSVTGGGISYAIGETITVADSELGGGGAPALTFDVASTGGFNYTGVAPSAGSADGNNATFDVGVSNTGDVSITINTGGIGYLTTETLTIPDTNIGNSGAPDVTFDVTGVGGFQYNGVASSAAADGTGATFNVTIDGSGAATVVQVAGGGLAYAIDETVTIQDAVLGNNGGNALTFDVASITAPLTYTNVPATSVTGVGTNATFDVTITANGAASISVNANAGLSYAVGNQLSIADSALGNSGAAALTFDVNSIKAPPLYTNIATTSNGSGTGLVTQITIDSSGAINFINIVNAGQGYLVGDTITVLDSAIGNTGAADITFQVASVSGGAIYVNVVPTSTSGSGTGATFNITVDASGTITNIATVTAGRGFAVGEVITIADADLGNRGAANFTFQAATTTGITYSSISTWSVSPSGGTAAVFDVVIDNLGAITSVTPTNRGASFSANDVVTIADAQLGGTGAANVEFTVTSIQGHQYNAVVPASNTGSGQFASFDITINGSGAASAIAINNPGQEFQVGDTFTVTDAQIGNYGGANLTFQVATLQAITYSNISAAGGSGTGATIDLNVAANGDVTVQMNKTGRGYSVDNILTVTDSQLGGYGYTNVTLTVATIINVFDTTKQNRGTASLFNATDAIIDTTSKKYGEASLQFNGANHFTIEGLDLNTTEWTLQAWFHIASATHTAAASTPTFFETHPNDGSVPSNVLKFYIDGVSGSADFGKVKLDFQGAEVAESTSATIWANFASDQWVHIALVKSEPSLGSYTYTMFSNGTQIAIWTNTTNIGIDNVYVGGTQTPTTDTTIIGHVDDFVVDDDAQYTGSSFTAPDAEVLVRTNNSNLALVKLDRLHNKRGTYALSTLSDHTSAVIVENTNWTYNTQTQPPITQWNIGPGGLQILDYADVNSQLTTGIYNFTNTSELFASKTSTVPTPGGRKLVISPSVIPKYYIKDAAYQKIDNVQTLTLNQEVKFSKGEILQQYNDAGTTQRYGTIVEIPVGTEAYPNLGTTYKIGNIFPAGTTFDLTQKLRSTSAQDFGSNVITGISFVASRAYTEWEQAKSYTTGDVVYSAGRIYTATTVGTSGLNAPTHDTGNATDGGVSWDYTQGSTNPIEVDLSNTAYPTPRQPLWQSLIVYDIGDQIYYGRNLYTCSVAGRTSKVAPSHGSGTATDGTVTWTHTQTFDPLSDYATFKDFDATENWYAIRIDKIFSDSNFIANDSLSIGGTVTVNPKVDQPTVLQINNVTSVEQVSVTAVLDKTIKVVSQTRSNEVFCVANSRHNFTAGDILFTEGFTTNDFNGSFFIKEVFSSRNFIFTLRGIPAAEPAFVQNSIARVNIYTKHPTLILTRNHNYIFDMSDSSNAGYFLSFSQDNEFKLEYSFNNIEREGTPGVFDGTNSPFVKLKVDGQVTNISYYFDPSRIGANSPVGSTSFVDVKKTPFDGTYTVTETESDTIFKFPLIREPEFQNANVGENDQDVPYSTYSTSSKRAIGPIANIKLISAGGFYKKLPIIQDIASFRQIERINITSGGSEYAIGTYDQVSILGDGEGGLCRITVAVDEEIGSGTITSVVITDPGKGYTTGSVDVDSIQGILGPQLTGSGADLEVVIPDEGTGASVFLTGKNIGKIKKLKNNEFGYGYSHDYTLKPEITFPVNLQLFNTSILSQIKITNPGAGYTSAPSVIVVGGGGFGAEAVAIVKNNRLNEIQIKNPGAGYSSEPVVNLKSEFNYVVNLDLNYLQFNFPHGITQGAAISFRADDVGSTEGELPKPSSAGLTSLVANQIYYAIAGDVNSLESDQIRFALTPADAESGNYITFLTQGAGRQVLLTEVFGGAAEAIVETSRFLQGERVYMGDSEELATVFATVSNNNGWQIGPKILKLVDLDGEFVAGQRVNGTVSRASGVIDNISLAKGVLNIGSLTETPGKFIDDVGKPSEIVQKIQDSFFYQNFSYVIKTQSPINLWKAQILENNHPAGFNMFGQLQLTGGKDISGRKVGTEFIKQVNINEYSNVNEVTSFAAAEPQYSDFNNTEVLFRRKRLTNSEEILTSIVKKLDDIASQFDGIETQFPITVEGEQVIVNNNQLLILLNGVVQAPVVSYDIVGGNIVFKEAPKAPSKVVYRDATIDFLPITRLTLSNVSGIFPEIGYQITGNQSDAFATVISSAGNTVDIVDITGGPFQNNERIDVGALGFSALIDSQLSVSQENLFEFDETLVCTNRSRGNPTAQINAINLNVDGTAGNDIVLSKTSGTAEYEVGVFDFRLQDIVYSTRSNLAARITVLAPYRDPITNDVVDTQELTAGSSFYGLLFERLISQSYPNVLLDDISKSSITPVELLDSDSRINANFLDFEEVRSQEITYTDLSSGVFSEGDTVRNIKVNYNNPVLGSSYGVAANRHADASFMIAGNKDEIVDFATAEIAVMHPDFYYPGASQTDGRSRYRDAYRLIQKNKEYIVAKAFYDMTQQYPSLVIPNSTKCKRDLTYYVDAIAYDVFAGGNKYARKFIEEYYSNGNLAYINAQVTETVWGYNKAADYMKSALTNQLTGSTAVDGITYTHYADTSITPGLANYGGSGSAINNDDAGACADIQAALDTLAATISETLLSNQDFSDITPTEPTSYNSNETKCRRDVGLFVDAIVKDVRSGGNTNTVSFSKSYFEGATFINNGVVGEQAETWTALSKARDLTYRAINNLLYYKVMPTSGTGDNGVYNLNDPSTYDSSTALVEFTPTAAVYTPNSGSMVLTIGSHSLTTSDTVTIRPHSLSFQCDMDGGQAIKTYPQPYSTPFEDDLAISATSATTITVNVGASPLVQFTPTGATYNPATGDMEITIGAHSLEAGKHVTIADQSISFTCTQDSNVSVESYPRTTDMASGASLMIEGATATTITVNVGTSPASQQYAHTYSGASANAISAGGGFTHTFINASAGAVYTGGGVTAHSYDVDYASGGRQSVSNCANVQSTINTLTDIGLKTIAVGNLDYINALANIDDGSFREGETVRVNKIAYKDKSSGLFALGDSITAKTSGATFKLAGVNAGLKWLFADATGVSATLQDREYLTNSTLTNPGSSAVTQSIVVTNKSLANSNKSLKFVTNSYLKQVDSYDFDFGTGNLTFEAWIYPTGISGTQYIFDCRRGSATSGLNIRMVDQTLRVFDHTTNIILSSNVFTTTNTWYHVAVVRNESVMSAYVNGTQAGSNASNSTDFGYGPCYIGADRNGSSGFIGNMDNIAIRKGEAYYTSAFTAPSTVSYGDTSIVLGLTGDTPFILSTTEVYATFTGTTVSSATAKSIDYDNKRVIIEDIDLSRDGHRVVAEILEKNDLWIAEVAVGRMQTEYPDFIIPGDNAAIQSYGGTTACIRDTRDYILDAIIKDLKYGGDYYTTTIARGYLATDGSVDFVEKELLQTLFAWQEAGRLAKYVVTTSDTDLTDPETQILRIPHGISGGASVTVQNEIDTLTNNILDILGPTGDRYRDAGNSLWKNRTYIAEEAVGYIQNKWQVTINGNAYDKLVMPGYGEPYCLRDLKDFVIPAIISDLITGGNSAVNNVIDQYLDSNKDILHVDEELLPMVDAIEYCKYLSLKAINQLLVTQGNAPPAAQGADYSDDYYIALYTQQTAYRQQDDAINNTVDPVGYDFNRSDIHRYLDAANMIEVNKDQIASEAVMSMNDLSKFSNIEVPGGQVNCMDDVKDYLDAVIHDLRLGGNSKVYDAAELYIEPEDNSLKHIEGEEEASIYVYKQARDMAVLTMRNGFGKDLVYGYGVGEENDPGDDTYDQNPQLSRYIDAANLIDRNIRFIAEEAVHRATQQYPSFSINGGQAGTRSGGVKFTPTNAVYTASTGEMVLTIGAHSLTTSNKVYIELESIVFTCAQDGNASNHPYPRNTDPAYDASLPISAADATTITVNVGASPVGQQYAHTFVSALPDAVTSAGSVDCVHDITDILQALVFHLKYGGNSKVVDAAQFYVNASNALLHVGSQATETVYAMVEAKKIMFDVMRSVPTLNTGNHVHNYSQKFYDDLDFYPYRDRSRDNPTMEQTSLAGATDSNKSRAADAYWLIRNNARYIAEGTVGMYVANNGWTIPTGTVACVDDVERIIQSVAYHVAYAGNSYIYDIGEEYVNNPHLDATERQRSTSIISYIRSNIIDHIIRNELIPSNITTSWGSYTSLQQYRDLTITTDVTQPACPTEVSAAQTLMQTVEDILTANSMSGQTRTVANNGGPCSNVEAAIDTIMQIVTDTITTPTSLASVQRTLPAIWPIKYSGNHADRDLSVTYDSAAAGWNSTCATIESAINTLFDVGINTIEAAWLGATPHLGTISRTAPASVYTNTKYQAYTCYNVLSATMSLYDLLSGTLGAAKHTDHTIAEFIRFNDHAIAARAIDQTVSQYPTGVNPDTTYTQAILEAMIYDLATGGNAGAFELAATWFDGEGTFIAYPDIDRIRLIFAMNKVREYAKDIVMNYNSSSWSGYDTFYPPAVGGYQPRIEYDQEYSEFSMDSSLNCLEFALERSTFPSENVVTFTASTDAVNLTNVYDEGEDYNTDPALVLLTPTIEVGFEREENRVRINRTNFFRRGDLLQYTLASATSLDGANDQDFYYVLNAQANWFEIARVPQHDGRYRPFRLDTTNSGNQNFTTARRSGIIRNTINYGTRDIQTPISAGFNIADVLIGTATGASSEVSSQLLNRAEVVKTYKYFGLSAMSQEKFVDGEVIQVQGATVNQGIALQTIARNELNNGHIRIRSITGTISAGDVLEGVDSGATATVTSTVEDRLLINTKLGQFFTGDWLFKDTTSTEAKVSVFNDKRGVLTGNTGGRITVDVETINSGWESGDVIYGSKTEKILDLVGIRDGGSPITINTYIHGDRTIKLSLSSVVRDTGYTGNFTVGDEVYLLQGTAISVPGWTAYVTNWDYRPDDGINDLYIGSVSGDPSVPANQVGLGGYTIGKFENLNNFPVIYGEVSAYTETAYESYGRIVSIEQSGITARVWLEDVVGTFTDNMTLISDNGWIAATSTASDLVGRVDRYFRGFDGEQTIFKLTIANGEQYLPDPAGHMMIFVNGIMQPPGANNAFTASSDEITFTEPPEIGSEFIGYYVGKLRQLDDISFEFDSLRSSFNLKITGGFYSLTLTEGVSSNTIKPENNIICSLNGVIQEPGIGYTLVGSRIIFAETPRAGSTFVAFSYVGSEADVIASYVVPPIEAGDKLFIEGEDESDPREVALIESSNSLVTFEYTGTVKGRNASALATIRRGTIDAAIITNPGNGYTTRPNVAVISSSGFDGRIRALMGIANIAIKTPGVGYSLPEVTVSNVVEDDFVTPEGAPVNDGLDVYAGEGIDPNTGQTITIENGAIQITRNPSNVTVNQGQTAAFTVIAVFNAEDGDPVGTTSGLNYQWQRKNYGETNWTNITGANQATYDTGSASQADDSDEYRVAITYAGATPVYSNSAVLNVQTGATVISNFVPNSIFAQ